MAFRRLNISSVVISRTRGFGGLTVFSGVGGISNVDDDKTGGSASVRLGYRCLSRVGSNENVIFTANAPVSGAVYRVCIVRLCLRGTTLRRVKVCRFSS